MNSETLSALKGSIKKWERIVEGTGADKGHKNCPLCELFLGDCASGTKPCRHCEGCPVFAETGEALCGNTPYHIFSGYLNDNNVDGGKVFDRHSKQLAKNELEFLKGLLPVSAIKPAKPVKKVTTVKTAKTGAKRK